LDLFGSVDLIEALLYNLWFLWGDMVSESIRQEVATIGNILAASRTGSEEASLRASKRLKVEN